MVAHWGAVPVFVDVDPVTFNIDPDQARKKITGKTAGIIPVSLYGQCPDMDGLDKLASEYGLWVMEDGAQSLVPSIRVRNPALSVQSPPPVSSPPNL
jgi:UDP-2-acetamido-2-deoxy-ribo-hexuluronate aminotransferase